MRLQYAFYDPTDTSLNDTFSYSGGPTETAASPFAFFAGGAFDGADGLPPDSTPLNSVADFQSYVSELEAKTTQISAEAVDLNVTFITAEYVVLGGTAADVITADATTTADGSMMGRDGNDSLTGGAGHDKLEGDAGADTLVSAGDGDTLNGGSGADTYVFTALTDHRAATFTNFIGDTLDLSAVDADTNDPGIQAFTLVTHFDGHAGELQIKFDHHTGRNEIRMDTDGDGHANCVITVVTGNDFSHIVY